MASVATAGLRLAGESAGLDPTPKLAGVDILLFDAEGPSLRAAVHAAKDTAVRLVALFQHPDEQALSNAIDAGVAAILMRRDLEPRGLIGTLRTVAAGNTALPADLLPKLLARAANGSSAGPASLTERELAVLDLLSEGADTNGIAEELCYSERTVKNIVHDVLMKMNCRNRAHAVALATRQGLI